MLALVLPGATATLVRAEGERFRLHATRAYAPGTPLKATVQGSEETLEFKVARSARRADGTFDVEGRLVNLTRVQRGLLAAALGDRFIP